jgi:diguanylate cyclase (GGDEF)-like protein
VTTAVGDSYGCLDEVLDSSPDGLVVFCVTWDAAGCVAGLTVEYANAAGDSWLRQAAATHGRAKQIDHSRLRSLDPAREDVLWDLVATVAVTGRSQRLRVHRSLPTGEVVLDVALARMGDRRVIAASRDVSDVVADESLLAAAYEETAEVQATLQTALDATTDAFAIYDLNHDGDHHLLGLRLVLMNASGARELGLRCPADVVGMDLRDFHPSAVTSGLWTAVLAAASTQSTHRFRLREQDETGGCKGAWDYTIALVGSERMVITWRDVTDDERRESDMARASDAARYAATHDALTGLANRALLWERITEALREVSGEESLAVVFLDLDGFKQVNDTYGHAAGDHLLCAVATRLANLVRAGDTVARLGGDEFVILLRFPRHRATVDFIARARAAIEHPVQLTGGLICPQASFGVVRCPPGSGDLDEIICQADQAMYRDKLERRQRHTDAAAPHHSENFDPDTNRIPSPRPATTSPWSSRGP